MLQTAISRVVTSLPILVVPPVAMSLLDRTKMFARFPRLRLPVELGTEAVYLSCDTWHHTHCAVALAAGVISACLVLGLPAAVALFPPKLRVPPSELEERFKDVRDPSGRPYEYLQFNKGL